MGFMEVMYEWLASWECPMVLYSFNQNRFKVPDSDDLMPRILIVKDGFTILYIWIDDEGSTSIHISIPGGEEMTFDVSTFSKRFLDDDNFLKWSEIKKFIDDRT